MIVIICHQIYSMLRTEICEALYG